MLRFLRSVLLGLQALATDRKQVLRDLDFIALHIGIFKIPIWSAMKSRSLRTCLRSVASACKPRRTERRNRSIYEYVRIPSTARRRITGAQQDHKQVLSNAPLQ